MADLISLVLDIPDAVDCFVKICRLIEAYKGIETKHTNTIQDAIHYSRKLNYYAHFVDCTPNQQVRRENGTARDDAMTREGHPTSPRNGDQSDAAAFLKDSQELLYDLFKNSLLALDIAHKVVDDWTLRLGISNADVKSQSQRYFARVALALSERLAQKSRVSAQTKRKTFLPDFRGKTSLLIIGNQQIEDAMGRLKHWLRELHDVLMTSPVLHRRLASSDRELLVYATEPSDDILFVAMARERDQQTQTMEKIKPDLITERRPLDDRKGHNFMLIIEKNSPYSNCLVDRRNVIHLIDSQKEAQALKDTERIARLFAEEKDELGHVTSASVGILPCCGFTRPSREFHDLVFRLPPGSLRPRTLRTLLLQGDPQHSLNARLDFSIKLATAVLILHSLNLVHKDIRPDSIVVIESISETSLSQSATPSLGEPYLLAFNGSRSLDSSTVPYSVAQFQERRWATLYEHPRHLSTHVHLPFEMRDDIYSLGICLLEIALWRSLFLWDETNKVFINDASVCDLSEDRYDRMLQEMGEDPNVSYSWFRQIDLVQLAGEKVVVTMGEAFRDIAVECLSFGMGKRKMADVLKGKELGRIHFKNQSVAFIRNVLSKLRSLKLA